MKQLLIKDDLAQLSVLIRSEREHLLSRWREQVRELPSAQNLDRPTLTDHIPQLLDQFALGLETRSNETIPEALKESQPPAHGVQRVIDGFDIAEVVAEYNILRGCIHDLADDNGLKLQGRAFRILNRVFDEAIGSAVRAYAGQRALEVQQQRGEYLAFVAHDLRTPLSAISLATKVLDLKLTKPNASASLMLKVLHRNLEYLDKLVGKVLEENANLSTELGIRLERRSFDLWPLIAALIYDLNPVAGTGSTRLVNEVPDALVVYADASLLKRVFQNLIANAIRYTPSGKIVVGGREIAAGTVECWVRDNGAGIPPELLEKVFDKSVTGPRNDEASGTGLGLAIVSTFVEAHGGKVSVESNQKTGTTFRFTLPGRE
jgi:two-component system phosphate regulon sensor histidine kinase PhoR